MWATLVAIAPGAAATPSLRSEMAVTDGVVNAVVVSGGIVYLGGAFSQAGPATGSAAALDVTTGLPLGFPEVGGDVRAVVPDGAGGWYVGGRFTRAGGQARANLAHSAMSIGWCAPSITRGSFRANWLSMARSP